MPAERPAAAAAQDSPARRIFDQLDTNHDGMLTFEEFSKAQFGSPK
jgi:Ca2+-binding EF-hand superfamily protein